MKIDVARNTSRSFHVKKYNSLNISNPNANSFVPACSFMATLPSNPLAQEFSVLNPYAPNITLIAMSTILILSAFLTIEINENDKLEFNNT